MILTIDTDHPGAIDQALAVLAFLSDDRPAAAPPRLAPATAQAVLEDLWRRISPPLREWMETAARFDSYSTCEMAEALGLEVGPAKARRANLGRSVNAAMRLHPGAPAMFVALPNQRFAVSPAYRGLISAFERAQNILPRP